jgi:hypothetical protein
MTLVLLSVFISVIITNYQDLQESSIRPQDLHDFANKWFVATYSPSFFSLLIRRHYSLDRAEYDPDATCLLPLDRLMPFVAELFVPFGFGGKPFSEKQYLRRVGKVGSYSLQHELLTLILYAY